MTIGIIGGGQLALMMIQESPEHSYIVIDPNKECSVKDVAELIVANYDDENALKELNDKCEVITYEFENIPTKKLKLVEGKLFPNIKTLYTSQNRMREKQLARDLSIQTPFYMAVNDIDSLKNGLRILKGNGILKTQEGGYDGKGQLMLTDGVITKEAVEMLSRTDCILEEIINFEYETSLIASRDRNGNFIFYKPTVNKHVKHILSETINVKKVSYKNKAKAVKAFMEHLDVIGTFTMEIFVTEFGFVFNEIAPRVHNSGHWTIEGTDCSQFKNHIRAITGLAVKKPLNLGYTAMINIIGDEYFKVKKMKLPTGVVFHDYFKKEVREGRKMGHVTINDIDRTMVENKIKLIKKGVK